MLIAVAIAFVLCLAIALTLVAAGIYACCGLSRSFQWYWPSRRCSNWAPPQST